MQDLEREYWLPHFFEVGLEEIASPNEKVPPIDNRETTQRRNLGLASKSLENVGSACEDKDTRYSNQNDWRV